MSFIIKDMNNKVHEHVFNEEGVSSFFQSMERLANVLRCEWEYKDESTLTLKSDGKTVNIFYAVAV
jgi:hypothetical protein